MKMTCGAPLVVACCLFLAPTWSRAEAGIEGDLVFEQDGKDLVITGKGFTTGGLFIVQTDWREEGKDEIVLIYSQVYNKDTVRRSPMEFQVRWRLKNRIKGNQTFTVRKAAVVFLTPEELKTLLGTQTQDKEESQPAVRR